MDQDPEAFIAQAKAVAKTHPVEVTVRALLSQWGAKRRGYWIVAEIDRDLTEAGLTTDPPFTETWIDSQIQIIPIEVSKPSSMTAQPDLPAPVVDSSRDSPAAIRISSLPSANKGVRSVAPDASLAVAQSVMLRYDYSQLAVMSGDRTLRGAISWESIAQARLRKSECPLKDAIIPAEPVDLDHDLLALIPVIVDKGFVFVRATDRRIAGIVTMADLSLEFANLAKPFFSIGDRTTPSARDR